MPFIHKEDKIVVSEIDDAIIQDFKTQLIELLNELFNTAVPFVEKI
jgi:hypothetical protein